MHIVVPCTAVVEITATLTATLVVRDYTTWYSEAMPSYSMAANKAQELVVLGYQKNHYRLRVQFYVQLMDISSLGDQVLLYYPHGIV